MDAASELRQAHRTAALIIGGFIMGLLTDAVIASVAPAPRPRS
jgi:cell shape-determining protein MreD